MMVTLLAPLLAADRAGWIAMAGEAWQWGWSSPWLGRQLNPVVIVFAGLVINLYLAAISMGLLLFFQEELKGLLVWERISGPEQLERRRLSAATVAAGRDAGGGAGAPAGSAGAGRCQRTQPGVSPQASAPGWSGPRRLRHRLRGERGGADRFYRAGGARHGAAAGGQKTGPAAAVGTILGALLLAATDLLLQTLSQFWPVLIPTGAMTALLAAAALADPASWHQAECA